MGETNTIIKVGSMIKRSQNKKRWSLVNYKTRYFELSHTHLMYFDNNEGGEVRALWFYYFFTSFWFFWAKIYYLQLSSSWFISLSFEIFVVCLLSQSASLIDTDFSATLIKCHVRCQMSGILSYRAKPFKNVLNMPSLVLNF
jgi:hypothetical protein